MSIVSKSPQSLRLWFKVALSLRDRKRDAVDGLLRVLRPSANTPPVAERQGYLKDDDGRYERSIRPVPAAKRATMSRKCEVFIVIRK